MAVLGGDFGGDFDLDSKPRIGEKVDAFQETFQESSLERLIHQVDALNL
jgi:hypothetical protein